MKPEQQKAFDIFWNEHWPKCRRKQKKQAADQWSKISPELYETIYAAVERQKKQPEWNKENCAFIPYAFRWLRDRRWEDEIALPEDKDADVLIAALQEHSSCPAEIPRRILDRFMRMASRDRTNWTRLHIQIEADPAIVSQVRQAYLNS